MPGSDRQFAWIRICTLTQLGRAAEAQPLQAAMYPSREPTDKAFRVPGSETIRYRLFRCTGDAAAAAHELAADVAGPLGGLAFLHLQPAYRIRGMDPAFARRVAAEPEMMQALAGRFRALSATLAPALNRWLPGSE